MEVACRTRVREDFVYDFRPELRSSSLILAILAAMRRVSLRFLEILRRFALVT